MLISDHPAPGGLLPAEVDTDENFPGPDGGRSRPLLA